MFRRFREHHEVAPEAAPTAAEPEREVEAGRSDLPPDVPAVPDLTALPIAGVSRRRVGIVIVVAVAVWVGVAVARQVGEAQGVAQRAEAAAERNIALSAQVAALERELHLIQRQAYIVQQARGYGLGGEREIAFTLADDAPPLSEDAPGSAAVRLGAAPERVTPLDSWLSVLFGPER